MMLKWLWDLFFTRSEWKVISGPHKLTTDYGAVGVRYILQNQRGQIKKRDLI